jgi:hypothetical protein
MYVLFDSGVFRCGTKPKALHSTKVAADELRFDWRPETPRGVLRSNRGFVELGSYAVNRLRRLPSIELSPWNASERQIEPTNAGPGRRDSLLLARYYQSLLDTGKFESRAALARFLGVSRARVTQVLARLHKASPERSSDTLADLVESRGAAAG